MADSCEEVRDAVERGLLDERVGPHLERCPPCAEAVEREAPPAVLRDAERARAGGAEEKEAAAMWTSELAEARVRPRDGLRALPTPTRLVLGWGAAAAVAAICLAVHPRPDLATVPKVELGLYLSGLAAIAAIGVHLAIRPLHWPAWRPSQRAFLAAATIGMPVIHAIVPHGHGGHEGSLPVCLAVGVGAGMAIAVAVRFLARGPSRPGVAVGAGVAAAGVSNLGLCLFCGTTTASHLLAGHASVAVGLVLAVALVLRPRTLRS